MTESTLPCVLRTTPARAPGLLDRWARRLAHAQAAKLRHGELTVADGGERATFGLRDAVCDLAATVTVHDPRYYRELLFGGTLGHAEAYFEGWWTCDDLPALMRIFLRNRAVMTALESGWARLSEPFLKLLSCLRRNTRAGSRRNIAAHYDLGNEFFATFLDETLMYSCAVFEPEQIPLAEASRLKNDRICRKLRLSPADHLLEIGTGWGGFALHAAREYGCRVTTTTISQKQYELAARRVEEAGLAGRVTVLRRDYRDLDGRYDKLVSIEMIEAVGDAYWDAYFRRCSELLAPDGLMLLQAIVIGDQDLEAHRRSVDFIKRYIFPGSCLPSVAAICETLARVTDLRLFHFEDITRHYVTTLRRWKERFLANVERVRALGFPESFVRMWEYYFAYCEGGFLERHSADVQMLFVKPWARP